MRVEVDNARVVGPVGLLRRAVHHHQAGPGRQLPRRHPADGRERHPVRAAGGRRGRRHQPRGQRGRRVHRRRRSARSTTRSSAATSSPPPRSARSQDNHLAPVVATAPGQEAAVHRHLQRGEPGPVRPGQQVPAPWPRASSPTWPRPTSSRSRRCRTTTAPPTTAWSPPTRRISKLTAADRRGRRPALRLARDRPGQRPGRRPAGRQHPGRVPVQPGRGDVRRRGRAARSTGPPPAPRSPRRRASRR